MVKQLSLSWVLVLLLVFPVFAKQKIIAPMISTPPIIDGNGDDAAWERASQYEVMDVIAKIPIDIQAVYTETSIYIKVRFPDESENRKHKMLVWNDKLKAYKTGMLREDSFVLKWNMEPLPVDFSLQSSTPYRADIWFWKAFRTDPVGYADDKLHVYSGTQDKKSKRIVIANGKVMFLRRPADDGTSSYKSLAYGGYTGETVVRYKNRQPTGSRADVKAKGQWNKGFWTIEFERNLQTGHGDDIQFDTDHVYLFGLSRFEIGGKRPNPNIEQPLYESGDVGEVLEIHFER